MGYYWRVANREYIRAFKVPWLIGEGLARTTSIALPGLEDMKVAKLLNEGNHEWNKEKLEDLFTMGDIQHILAISVSI